jgi:hypothetical protein
MVLECGALARNAGGMLVPNPALDTIALFSCDSARFRAI